jgi:phosphoglycerate kinase
MVDFLTMDDVDVNGKTILLRIDINVPYDEKTGKIGDSDRMVEHSKTIKELSDNGAKVVLLAHQGRKGDVDFIHLDQHARLLEKHVGKKVEFIEDVSGEKAKEKIKSLKPCEILLLDNVRFLEDEDVEKTPEEHRNSTIVKALSEIADIFINDAFSAAHRSHASVVGFTATLPSYAGRVMSREVEKLGGILDSMKVSKNDVFVLGGAKPNEPLDVIKVMVEKDIVEKFLVSGVIGELFIMANGHNLGATENFLKKKEYLSFLPKVKELLEKHGDRIEFPVDVAIQVDDKRNEISIDDLPTESLILDIGEKTIEKYIDIIKGSSIIAFKGPSGKYEEDGFGRGTKAILETIADCGKITLVGGGNTLETIDKFKISREKFTHVSLGGGAFIEFITGKPMPAIEALKNASQKNLN